MPISDPYLTKQASPQIGNPMKAIIFDLDGTLIDSMQLWREVDAEFLGKRGITVPENLFEDMPHGNSFIQTADYFRNRFNLPDTTESIMQEWTTMVREHYSKSVPLKPGVTGLVPWIKEQGILIGLGTSNSYELARIVLTANGIWDYFLTAVTGDMHLKGKPYPDIYIKAAKDLNVSPEDCLVIEDTLSGINAAKAANMKVFAIYDADADNDRAAIIAAADGHFTSFGEIQSAISQLIGAKYE